MGEILVLTLRVLRNYWWFSVLVIETTFKSVSQTVLSTYDKKATQIATAQRNNEVAAM